MKQSLNIKLLKEEDNQKIYLWHNGKWNEGTFLWFYKGNIEISINGQLIAINKERWHLLSLTGIDHQNICMN